MTMLKIDQVHWSQHWRELTEIRRRVFIEEQKVPVELELDEHDFTARHWLAWYGAEPVGTVRLLDDGHIGRLAVAASYRERGIGQALLHRALEGALEMGLEQVELAAQEHAIAFYRKEGFKPVGGLFMDAGIPHQTMQRVLRNERRLGEDGRRFHIDNLDEAVLAVSSLARRQLRIFCHSLEAEHYAQPRLLEIISELARKHRDSEVRVIICDDRPLREIRHPLVDLSQRLSSSVQIRICRPEHYADFREYFLVADKEAIIAYGMNRSGRGWGGFNERAKAKEHSEQFDRLWHLSKPSAWLKKLF